ncbi:MAG: hypothetical protein NXI32_01520 [bacterium]|nr:hypothetical protein [bacterium]
MNRVMLGLALAIGISCSTGCETLQKRGHGVHCNNCQDAACNGPLGCRPCRMGWQRGGTDYGGLLSHAGAYCHAQPSGHTGPAGPATAQVAYPYYTVRGPRDFFLDNPPSIGR